MTLIEMISALGAPVEVEDCRVKKMSDGTRVVYLPWWKASELADARTGGRWSSTVTRTWCEDVPKGSKKDGYTGVPSAHVTILVTLHGEDAVISREAVGVDDDPTGQRGTPHERAVGAAVRRALALFGLGRALYDKSVARAYLDCMPNEQQDAGGRQDARRPAPSPRTAAAPRTARPPAPAQGAPAAAGEYAGLLEAARKAKTYQALADAMEKAESVPAGVGNGDGDVANLVDVLVAGVTREIVGRMPAAGYEGRKMAAVGELLGRVAALAARHGRPADAVEQARTAVGLGQEGGGA